MPGPRRPVRRRQAVRPGPEGLPQGRRDEGGGPVTAPRPGSRSRDLLTCTVAAAATSRDQRDRRDLPGRGSRRPAEITRTEALWGQETASTRTRRAATRTVSGTPAASG